MKAAAIFNFRGEFPSICERIRRGSIFGVRRILGDVDEGRNVRLALSRARDVLQRMSEHFPDELGEADQKILGAVATAAEGGEGGMRACLLLVSALMVTQRVLSAAVVQLRHTLKARAWGERRGVQIAWLGCRVFADPFFFRRSSAASYAKGLGASKNPECRDMLGVQGVSLTISY